MKAIDSAAGPAEAPRGGFERRLLESLTELDQAREPAAVGRPARRDRRRRPIVAVVAVAAVLSTAAGATAGAMLTLQSGNGEQVAAGSPVAMKGSDCGAGMPVTLWLDTAVPLGTTTVRSDGLYIAIVTVPPATEPGAHEIQARCRGAEGNELVETLPIRVTAAGYVEPLAPAFDAKGGAVPGGVVMFKGAGCRPDVAVTITVAEVPALEVGTTAGLAGEFIVSGFVPSGTATGRYQAQAECVDPDGRPLVQAAELTVLQALPVDRQATKPTRGLHRRMRPDRRRPLVRVSA